MTATPEPAEPTTTAETPAEEEQQHLYRDVIVVGASAGGVEALENLVRGLPPELPASIFVVLHLLSTGTSVLDSILARSGELPASVAVDGSASSEDTSTWRRRTSTCSSATSTSISASAPARTATGRRSTPSSEVPRARSGPG